MGEKKNPEPIIHVPPFPQYPAIKQSCDTALQSAYHEPNWPLVITLARQRYKSTKDSYYLALEVLAKSQSDNPSDRVTGRDAVLKLVAESNGIIKDVDTLDLYEYAACSTKINYAETVGVLRSRLVRAAPKDQSSSLRCLKACIYNSDWLHAQEITASMEKNFPAGGIYRIQNIFTTHMYSQAPTCPAKSADLLAKLAKLKGNKEFEERGLLTTADILPALSSTDQEAWLWLDLQCTPQTDPKDTIAALQKYALRLVDCGFNDTFILILQELQKLKAWDALTQICQKILDKAIAISQKEATLVDEIRTAITQQRNLEKKKKLSEKKAKGVNGDSTQDQADDPDEIDDDKEDKARLREAIEDLWAQRTDEDLIYLTLGSEPLVWNALINSVSAKKDFSQSLKQTRKCLDKFIKAFRRSGEAKDLDQSRYDRAVLRILFLRDAQSGPSEAVSNTRISHLLTYITKYYGDISCFDSVKTFLETLNREEVETFTEKLSVETSIASKARDTYKALALLAMELKVRYLFASDTKKSICKHCGHLPNDSVCICCFATITRVALLNYKAAMSNEEFRRDVLPARSGDPLSDLAILGSLSLLQLARVSRISHEYRNADCSPLAFADIQYVFQAIVWLDSYLTSRPKNDPLRLLLVKMYLLIGCVSRAQALWEKFDVKNAILDSLGALFFDRISTIAPGSFSSAISSPMDKFTNYYSTAIRRTVPKEILDAFSNGSWQSIPQMITFSEDLKRSCSLVMAVVEDRRGVRIRTGKSQEEPIEDNPLVSNLNLSHVLHDRTDYSYLPDFGSTNSVPTEVLVSHGPSLSNMRAHLSLLAERFVDLVSYAQPRDFKPSRPGPVLQLDQKYAIDTSVKIGRQMEHAFAEDSKLTGPEAHYYRLILKLTKLTTDFFTLYTAAQPAPDSRAVIESSIKDVSEEFKEQCRDFLDIPTNYISKFRAFHGFVALHAMGMLRESAVVVKLTASYLTAALDKAKALDKATSRLHNNETMWAGNQLKSLTAEAVAAEKKIEQRIKILKDLVQGGGWIDRLHSWTFLDSTQYSIIETLDEKFCEKEYREDTAASIKEAIGGDGAFETWAGMVVESWQELIRGWSSIKFT